MRQKIRHWLPAAFCAALACICVVSFISRSSGPGIIPFLCFLPMCFVFVAVVTSTLQREIRELREQVVKLQEKKIGSSDAA